MAGKKKEENKREGGGGEGEAEVAVEMARWSTYHPIHLNLKTQAKNLRDLLTIYVTQRLPTNLFLASIVLVHRTHDSSFQHFLFNKMQNNDDDEITQK